MNKDTKDKLGFLNYFKFLSVRWWIFHIILIVLVFLILMRLL